MHSRIRIFAIFIIFLFVALIVQLFYVQVVHSAYYKAKGSSQYISNRQENEPRGTIYFSTAR
jgi:cell division protein FtsI/penicillin-binding protein 2